MNVKSVCVLLYMHFSVFESLWASTAGYTIKKDKEVV